MLPAEENIVNLGQLTERFHIEKVRARDLWDQFSRFWRKLLAHTTGIQLSVSIKNEPLQFEDLVCHESCAIFRFGNSHIAFIAWTQTIIPATLIARLRLPT